MTTLVSIASFDNNIEAEAARAKLENEGIPAFLKDENIVSTIWLYSNAVGGIKLEVSSEDEARARDILQRKEEAIKVDHQIGTGSELVCPNCQSDNIKRESYSRAVIALSILFLGFPIPFPAVTYRCFYCEHQWKQNLRLKSGTTKAIRIAALVILIAISVIVYFRYFPSNKTSTTQTGKPIPESVYSWNAALSERKGNLIPLVREYQLGDLKGYTLFQGEDIYRSENNWQTDFYHIFTTQSDENIVSEIFAAYGYEGQPADEPNCMVHIALVKDLPALPLDVTGDEGNLVGFSFNRVYQKGPLKDSDYFGFFRVDIIYPPRDYTLFYVHKRNLLVEIAIPGTLDYYSGDEESLYSAAVFSTLKNALQTPDLGLINLMEQIEDKPENL